MTLFCLEKLKSMTEIIMPKNIASNIRKMFTRSSNVQLKCRLDRMERRMSLLKHRIPDARDSPPRQRTDQPNYRQCQSESLPSQTAEKSLKRKRTSFEPQNLSKRFATDTGVESKIRTTDNKLAPKIDRANRNRSRTFTISTEEIYSAWGYRARPGQIAADPDVLKDMEKRNILRKSESVDNSVLRTKDNYHISFYEPVSDNIEIDSKAELLKRAQNQLTVECPQWRIKTYTNQWGLEGTENMEDEIYVKRHTKPEIEEKRRKRWDLQRSREQAAYEKLKEKEKGPEVPKEETNNNIESFYPSLDDITHIEVTEKIPVMAFGHGVPKIDNSNFKLPWEVTSKKGYSHTRTRSRNM